MINIVGPLKGRGEIKDGNYRYHRARGKHSRHYPSKDRGRKARTKLRRLPAKSRRLYRHIAD